MVTYEGGYPSPSPLPGDRQHSQQIKMGDKVVVSAKPADDRSIPLYHIEK